MKKRPKIGSVLNTRNVFGYILISVVLLFIVFYIIDGVQELIHPLESFAFAYKSTPFYFLKLLYAALLIAGAYCLCKQQAYGWHIFQFTSIGILTSSVLFYFGGYVFRSSVLDLFLLEFLSLVLLLAINAKRTAQILTIKKPDNWLITTIFSILLNFVLNGSFWCLSGL